MIRRDQGIRRIMTENRIMTEERGCSYSYDMNALPSMCDSRSRLSIPAAFDMFQDVASFHSDQFDIGPDGMARRNYFWIISKTRLHINKMPDMMDLVTVSTWIQAAERVSCERDYSIVRDGELLAYGKSVWAVISRDTGRLVHLDELYPSGIEFDIPSPDDRSFARISKDFSDAEVIGTHTVRSIDIDLGGHMNNVNYVRAMLGCLSQAEIDEMEIEEVEVNFISQTYEGETLTFMRRLSDTGMEIGAVNATGKAVFTAVIR